MWFLYAILGLIFLGIGDFIKKMVLNKGGDKEIFLFMCFVFYIITLGINYIFFADKIITPYLMLSALIIGFFDFLGPLGMLTALKYLDSSFSFISIRLTSSFFILYIGVYVLGDNLSLYNIVGFFLGVIALYFLSGFNIREKHRMHRKGILAVIITIIGIVGGNSFFKYVVKDLDIPSYMLIKFCVTFLFIILYMTLRKKFSNFNRKEVKKVLNYALASCVIFVIYFLFIYPNIYILGPLSLGFKILSYSIIVPITLSIIFFHEKVTKKRMVAFVLTIISLALFLV